MNSEAEYLEKTWNGGLSAYINSQYDRYKSALETGNTNLMSKLIADFNRLGVPFDSSRVQTTVNVPSSGQTQGTSQTQPNTGGLGVLTSLQSINFDKIITVAVSIIFIQFIFGVIGSFRR